MFRSSSRLATRARSKPRTLLFTHSSFHGSSRKQRPKHGLRNGFWFRGRRCCSDDRCHWNLSCTTPRRIVKRRRGRNRAIENRDCDCPRARRPGPQITQTCSASGRACGPSKHTTCRRETLRDRLCPSSPVSRPPASLSPRPPAASFDSHAIDAIISTSRAGRSRIR